MRIPLVTTYDGRGVRKAVKGFDKLIGTSMAAKVSIAAVGAGILKFGYDAAAAAAADEKSQRMLNQALARSGWSKLTDEINAYISTTQLATGVSDTELRTSIVTLTNATNNAAASQALMNTALDVSAGTGKDLGQVVTALSKLMSGQRTSIMKLGTGIDATTIKTESFVTILGLLEQKFAGSQAIAADTFSGKISRIRGAIGEGKETVGYALLDVFAQLAGNGDIDEAAANINGAASALADFIRESTGVKPATGLLSGFFHDLGKGIADDLKLIPGLLKLLDPTNGALSGLIDAKVNAKDQNSAALKKQAAQWAARAKALQDLYNKGQLSKAALIAQQKAQKEAAKSATALAVAKAKEALAQKKANAEKAKALSLSKLAAKFDLTLIGIAAAKKRTTDKGDLNRLSAMNLLATDAAGLPVSKSALDAANAMNFGAQPQVFITVQGSVVTQAELTGIIADELKNAQLKNGYGKWGGGL